MLRIILTFAVVTVAWVVFRSSSIGDAIGLIGRYFTAAGQVIADPQALLHIAIALMPLLLLELGMEFFPKLYERIRAYSLIRWVAYLVIFSMIVLIGVHDGSSFIYVSF